jgi:4-amino-4-deoxy-L-arabinose transferase-like glycosyltransferase
MLLVLVGIGTLVRLAFAATTDGNTFDLASFGIVRDLLRGDSPLHLYDVTTATQLQRWPYPPGYFVAILGVDAFDGPLGISFARLIRVPTTLADGLLAWLVFLGVRDRFGESRALAAGALVALGPSFIAISGFHGQIDALAVTPVVAAIVLWLREVPRRALWCGLLVGAAAALKQPMAVFLLAFLPSARSRRELVTIVAAAIAVPMLLMLPWLLATPRSVVDAMSYRGLPGIGGLSLLVQPSLAESWLGSVKALHYSGATNALQDVNGVLVALGVIGVGLLGWRRRADVVTLAAALVLTVWVLGANFALGYLVWGLPLFLLAGRVREVAGLQALFLVPTLLIYTIRSSGGHPNWVIYGVFEPFMVVAFAVFVVAWLRLVSTLARRPIATS